MYKILIVDDDRDVVETIKGYLEADGHNVFGADNGLAALAIVEKEKPEIIFLDIKMEGLDGLEVLKKIKVIDRKAKVIMVSALLDLATRTKAQELGCDAYIRKPFEVDDVDRALEAKINELISDPRILIVEDEIGQIENIIGYLKDRISADFSYALTGEEALDMIRKEPCNIMIVDISLPGMDGFKVIKKVHEINPHIDILITTGYTYNEVVDEAVGNGVVDIMSKPLILPVLEKKIINFIQKRGFRSS